MTTRTKRRPTFWDMFISKKEVIGVLGTALGASEQKKNKIFAWNLTQWLNPASFLAESRPLTRTFGVQVFFGGHSYGFLRTGLAVRSTYKEENRTHSKSHQHHRLTTVRFPSESVYLFSLFRLIFFYLTSRPFSLRFILDSARFLFESLFISLFSIHPLRSVALCINFFFFPLYLLCSTYVIFVIGGTLFFPPFPFQFLCIDVSFPSHFHSIFKCFLVVVDECNNTVSIFNFRRSICSAPLCSVTLCCSNLFA
jgi:hypothetical protein